MISERGQRMVEEAPSYYQDALTYQQIQDAKAQEYDLLQEKIEDLRLQLNPTTATWGLKYYEKELGLPSDEAKPIEERRSNVVSKRRGFGNFSADLVKTVALSFTNGEVNVKNFLKNILNLKTNTFTKGYIGSDGTINSAVTTTWTQDENKVVVDNSTADNGGIISDFLGIGSSLPLSFAANPVNATDVAYVSVSFYTATQVFISRVLGNPGAIKLENLQPPSNAAYARVNVRFKVGTGMVVSPQLEIGAAATKFEPRKDYELEIKFVSNTGLPPNLDDFKAAIDNIIHAHLAVTYRFRYITVNEAQAMTINQLNSTQLTNFAPFSDIFA
jgi:hypothetical protein